MTRARSLAGTRATERGVLALALGAGIALAALPALAAGTTGAENAATGMKIETPAQIHAFNNAKLSLTDAITAAQKQSNGKVLDVSFQANSGKPMYDVTVWANNTQQMWKVDANTGQVTKSTEATVPQAKLDHEDATEVQSMKSAKTDLMQAVQTAEQKSGGKAIGAGIEAQNGATSYQVQTVKGGTVQAYTVNPQNGMAALAG